MSTNLPKLHTLTSVSTQTGHQSCSRAVGVQSRVALGLCSNRRGGLPSSQSSNVRRRPATSDGDQQRQTETSPRATASAAASARLTTPNFR